MTVAVAGALAGALAVVGRAMGWLTAGGAIAAAVVGTAIFAGAGPAGASLLALFFISSSLLTRVAHSLRPLPGDPSAPAGRDASQVMANGLWAAVGAVLIGAPCPGGGWPLLTGALAAAQGDTWATEIGAFSPGPPRLLSTGRKVPPGTSGGARLRLRGRGIHDPRAGATGDMYALVRIMAPKSLSPRAVELLKQFDDEAGFDPRADLQWRL